MPDVTLAEDIGEGGGIALRTALSLSAITQRSFRLRGLTLVRRHLTLIKTTAALCGGTVRGAQLKSRDLTFVPQKVRSGQHVVAFGAAASATLAVPTLLPPLLTATQPSELVCRGVTHGFDAPSYDFVDQVYSALLRLCGAQIDASLDKHGFHPAAGGSFRIGVQGRCTPKRLELFDAGPLDGVSATITFAHLPFHVVEREMTVVHRAFDVVARCSPHEVDASSSGNVVSIRLNRATPEMVSTVGAPTVPAERVAQAAVDEAKALIYAGVPVGKHLADQLPTLLAAMGGGTFRTMPLTDRSKRVLTIVNAFAVDAAADKLDDGSVRVRVESARQRR